MGSVNFPLPQSNGEVETCDPALRLQISTLEQRLWQGDFSGLDALYKTIPTDSRCFLLAARMFLMGAVGCGDAALFAQVMKDVRALPKRFANSTAAIGAELTEIWIRQFLNVTDGYPKWVEDGSIGQIPPEWQFLASFLTTTVLLVRREYARAYSAAQMLLYLIPSDSSSIAVSSYLKFVLATAMQKMGRIEECEQLFHESVRDAAEHKFVLMFLGVPIGFKSPLRNAFAEEAPDLLRKVRRMSDDFFRNKVHMHNILTGEQLAECLSPREFDVASSLRHGLRYKEIAEQLGITVTSVNSITKSIYAKLGIHGISSLPGKVW